MIKFQIRHVRAGLAGASGLMMIGQLTANAGCAAEGEDTGAVRESATALAIDPGTGTFDMSRASYAPSGPQFNFNTTNSTDEFVRVGERVTLTAPAWFLWQLLQETGDVPDPARVKQYQVTFHVRFTHGGNVVGTQNLSVTSWSGAQVYDLVAHTSSFVVPPRTDAIAFAVTIADPAGQKTVEVPATDVVPVPVFGGELPLKHAIFDNLYGALRQRVVEGGDLIAGATTVVTYTDWRADTLVDKSSIDRQIGTAQGYSRFGTFEMPIYGDIAYEISYGVAFDGAWRGEASLAANPSSRLLPFGGRTGFEATLPLPARAAAMDLYFHVKAVLVVDYSRYTSVTSRRYNQGDRILVRERWDNLNGQPNHNYDFPLARR